MKRQQRNRISTTMHHLMLLMVVVVIIHMEVASRGTRSHISKDKVAHLTNKTKIVDKVSKNFRTRTVSHKQESFNLGKVKKKMTPK